MAAVPCVLVDHVDDRAPQGGLAKVGPAQTTVVYARRHEMPVDQDDLVGVRGQRP